MQEADALERALRRVLPSRAAMAWWWRLRAWRMDILEVGWAVQGWLHWRRCTGGMVIRCLWSARLRDRQWRERQLADAGSNARAFVRGRFAD